MEQDTVDRTPSDGDARGSSTQAVAARDDDAGPSSADAAPPTTDRVSWYRDKLLLLTIAVVFAADQLTKLLVNRYLALYESWPSEGFVRLTHGLNTGTAFGLLPNQTTVLIVASLLAIGFLYYFYRTQALPMRVLRLGIGLQLGGAFGNLIDRLRNGAVVDFIDVGPWPIFNLADSSIVIGIAIIVGVTMLTKDESRPAAPPAVAQPQDD